MMLFRLRPEQDPKSNLSVTNAPASSHLQGYSLQVKSTLVNTLFTYQSPPVNGAFPKGIKSPIFQADTSGFLAVDPNVDGWGSSVVYLQTVTIKPTPVLGGWSVEPFTLMQSDKNGLYNVVTSTSGADRYLSYDPKENKIYVSAKTVWNQHNWYVDVVCS